MYVVVSAMNIALMVSKESLANQNVSGDQSKKF